MSESTSDPDAVTSGETPTEPATESNGKALDSRKDSFGIGDLVADREPADGNANTAVVVNCPPVSVSEWTAYGNTTVAEDNPSHPEDVPVIVVVYRSELDRYDPGWADRDDLDPYPLTDFNEADVSSYSFPATRLKSRDKEETAIEETGSTEESKESNANGARMSQIIHENTATSSSRVATDSWPEPTHDEIEVKGPEDASREPTDAALQLKERLENGGMTVEIEADGRTLAAEKLGETYWVRPGGDALKGDGLFAAKLERIAAEFEPQG